MMASEKAKALAAKQKADAKAAKLAKKNSTDPRDWGWFKQIVETYKMTAKVDPQVKVLVPGVALGVALLVSLLGIWLQPWWMWLLTGVMAGLVAALYVLLNRAKKGTYKRYEGQPGSAEVALSMLDKKKWVYTAAITATRQLDVVHRAVGPAGIVLVGEGSPARLKTLLGAEAKKHEQVAYGVPVTTVVMGDGAGQVPLDKLADHLKKLPKSLQPIQVTEVRQRLRALDAVRPKAPLPRGPLPQAKGVNRAMRGR
ncbi:MAG: DUF4191 domain-containing protein [Propionibacteriaceae bacterium]|nr:DUF4191 domain-containing protein [Propionibacteriaceae bacterium]